MLKIPLAITNGKLYILNDIIVLLRHLLCVLWRLYATIDLAAYFFHFLRDLGETSSHVTRSNSKTSWKQQEGKEQSKTAKTNESNDARVRAICDVSWRYLFFFFFFHLLISGRIAEDEVFLSSRPSETLAQTLDELFSPSNKKEMA